jgi:hypothetical protein
MHFSSGNLFYKINSIENNLNVSLIFEIDNEMLNIIDSNLRDNIFELDDEMNIIFYMNFNNFHVYI